MFRSTYFLPLIPGRRLALGLAAALGLAGEPGAFAAAYVRMNQAGYVTTESKQAVLLASGAESGTFSVINVTNSATVYTGSIPAASLGSWSSTFPDTYRLDFSALTNPGVYRIQVAATLAATSSNFPVSTAAAIYAPLLTNALFFFQSQRDGPQVLTGILNRKPCHLLDTNAITYLPAAYSNDSLVAGLTNTGGANIDASGGWFDAGDYPKFVETASYVEAVMWFTLRDYPRRLAAGGDFLGEARFGLDWLLRMWDQTNRVLYYQVGIGDGNGGTILGDHDYWRLPEADNTNLPPGNPGYYAISHRPAFRYGPAGSALSPNLAGRLAATFALASQVLRPANPALANQCLVDAQTVFGLAQTNGVTVFSTSPNDYYPETSWHDDLEWGAVELYFATAQASLPGLAHTNALDYLATAAYWAGQYLAADSGSDTLNLYDTSALAHYELYRAIAQAGNPGGLAVTPAALLTNLAAQLAPGSTQSATDPFRFCQSYAALSDPTPHALGLAVTANLYRQLTGATNYDAFGRAQRDWVLGNNAWGTTFIVGAGNTFPHCLQDQLANLGGNLNGVPPIRLGATVDGPSDSTSGKGTPGGADACANSGGFTPFNGAKAKYYDDVAYWMNVEPAIDYAAPTILLFAQQLGELPAAAPVLQSPGFTNLNFSFNLTGATGNQFVIQASANLSDWSPLETNVAPFGFTDTMAAGFPQRYYRALQSP
jgi:endoglucanase